MLFDHRTYTCKPGTIARQMALYEEHGMAAQQRNLGKPIFYAITETGGRRGTTSALRDVFVNLAVFVLARAKTFNRRHDEAWIDLLDPLPREPHSI